MEEALAQRCRPFLERGERVLFVFAGQVEPSIWAWIFAALWTLVTHPRYRIVCVTDRAIVVLKANGATEPTARLARYPLTGVPCLMTELSGQIDLPRSFGDALVSDERHPLLAWDRSIRVFRKYHDDLGTADAVLRRTYRPQGRRQTIDPAEGSDW